MDLIRDTARFFQNRFDRTILHDRIVDYASTMDLFSERNSAGEPGAFRKGFMKFLNDSLRIL
jgi:hypothetical protein